MKRKAPVKRAPDEADWFPTVENKTQFDRFQPITVRAAARLMTMAARGLLAPCEVDHYLKAMVATEPDARPGAHRSLKRLAQRLSAFGKTGVLGASRPAPSRLEMADIPECLKLYFELNR